MVNLPNILTLSRIPILFIIVGLLYMRVPGAATLAFLLFVAAGVTDWLDGYLARRMNLVSNFGKLMDALTDKIMMVGMFIALLALDRLPPWAVVFVLLIVAREFLITGLRLVAASNGQVLAAEKSGKQKTISQIVAIAVLLFVAVLERDVPAMSGIRLERTANVIELFGIASFVLATFLTVNSGRVYLVKYWSLVVSTTE